MSNNQAKEKTVAELAAHVGGRVVGDDSVLIERVASLEHAAAGEIAFVEDAKLLEAARASRASCLIVPEGARIEAPCVIEATRPKLAFALIAELLQPRARHRSFVDSTAIVAASAEVDASAYVGAYVRVGEAASIGAGTELYTGAIVGDGAKVGRDCVIHANAVLYANAVLGDRVILHAGVVIGADGFGYVRGDDGYHKFPQVGTVRIEDDVEIGANSCVDRGALGETRVGRGSKIDNLVQIAHNVQIGERVIIAAQTGVSGSTVIEDDAVIGGQVGMGDHARVGRGAIVGSKAGILPGKIVRAGSIVWGVPVRPLDEYKRLNAYFGRLPQMHEELKALREQVRELAARLNEKQ